MKVLFLDRDGVINKERGDYTWLKEQFIFTDNLFEYLRKQRDKGFQFVVITNQGGINKAIYEESDVEELHQWMKELFKKEGIELLDIFYCPHHSNFQKCLCRKPNSQMLEKAIAIHGIDRGNSYMIGDTERDVEAAKGAGVKGILVQANLDWCESGPEIN